MERVDLEQWNGREVARLLTLVETERRYYQEIIASLPVGLLVLSGDLSVVSSNRAVRRILGLRSTDQLRGCLTNLFPQSLLDQVQEVIRTGKPQTDVTVEHAEHRLRISVLPIAKWSDEAESEALLSIEDMSALAAAPAPLPTPALAQEPAPEVHDAVVEHEPAPAHEPEIIAEPAPAESLDLLQNLNAAVWAAEIPKMNFLFVTNKRRKSPDTRRTNGFSLPHFGPAASTLPTGNRYSGNMPTRSPKAA